MKIALFTDTYYPQINGVANTLYRLVNYWNRSGIESKIITPCSDESYPPTSNTHPLPSMSFLLYKECRVTLPFNRTTTQSLNQFQPDLIHVATPFSTGLYGLQYARKNNIPRVASYHTNFDHYLSYYHLQWATKWLWKYLFWFHSNFNRTYVPSLDTLHHLQNKGFTDLAIWGRGVDTTLFHPFEKSNEFRNKYQIPDERNVFTYVGRLAPEKDMETFIRIIKMFPKKWQERVTWLIVGEGPSYLEVKTALQSYSNVRFTGYLKGEELAKAYRISDLFIFPSPTETFGNVVLEAMASGIPVIGVNAGGVRHIIKEGQNGYLVRLRDAQAFIDRILFLFHHPKLLSHLSTYARQYACSQSWDTIFNHLTNDYQEITHRKEKVFSA